MKPSKWKIILIVFVLLGVISACTGPASEGEEIRGTLPSAVVSQRTETVPPVSEPTPARTPAQHTEAPEPEPPLSPEPTEDIPETAALPESEPVLAEWNYVLNTNTYKFHYPSCSSVNQMNPSNKREYTGTRDQIIAMGYSPCGRCHP